MRIDKTNDPNNWLILLIQMVRFLVTFEVMIKPLVKMLPKLVTKACARAPFFWIRAIERIYRCQNLTLFTSCQLLAVLSKDITVYRKVLVVLNNKMQKLHILIMIMIKKNVIINKWDSTYLTVIDRAIMWSNHWLNLDHTKNGFPLLRLTVRYIDVQTLPKVIAVGLEF